MTSPMGAGAAGAGGGAVAGSVFGPIGAIIGAVIGAGVGAYGSYQSGVAGQAMQNYRAQVANINAQIAQNRANTAFATGDIQAQVSGIQTGQRVGGIRAGIGAENLDIGSGSGRDVIASQTEVGQFEQSTIRNRAQQEAFGFQTAAFSDTAQANLDIAAGKQEVIAGDIGAGSSILSAATSVADKWTKYGQAFPTPFGGVSTS